MASHPSDRHVDTGGETPQLVHGFQRGAFVLHISNRNVSAIAIAQAHEQANAVIKANMGAIGVTEDPSASRRWIIAGPEVGQLVAQYDIASEAKETVAHTNHHEHTPKVQHVFLESVDTLFQVFTDMGNPFKEENRDLLSLDTNDIPIPLRKRAGTYSRWTQTTSSIPVQLNWFSHTTTKVEHVSWNSWMVWKAKCPHSTNQQENPSWLFPTETTLCGRYTAKGTKGNKIWLSVLL